MSDDLDFDMEVVEDDELDELGADGASCSEKRSQTENDTSREETGGDIDLETGIGSSGEPNPPDLDGGEEGLDQRETNPGIKDIDVEGWKAVRADDLMYITRGASPRPKGDPELFGGDIPWVKISDVDVKSERYATKTSDTVTEKGAQKSKHIPEDTLIVSNSGTCGYPVFLGMDACVHDGWLILKEYEEELNADYLYEYITWKQNYLKSLAPGSTQINLNTSRFGSLDIQVPPLPEQRKIASVLSAVDQAIQKTEAIIEQAKRVKRGLMRSLLTRGIKCNNWSRVQPSDNQDLYQDTRYGPVSNDWEILRVSDIVRDDRPVTYGIVQPGEYTEGGIPLIRGQNYIGGWDSLSEFFRVDPKLHEKYSRCITRPRDVLICIAGANTGSVNIVPEWIEEANLTQTTARVSVNEEVALPEYIRFALASSFVQNQIAGWTRGSAQPGLNLSRVEKFKVPLPSKTEQERIVARLESISSLIAGEEESADRLSKVKKGLMQDLLTGEVRTADKAIEVLDEVKAHG